MRWLSLRNLVGAALAIGYAAASGEFRMRGAENVDAGDHEMQVDREMQGLTQLQMLDMLVAQLGMDKCNLSLQAKGLVAILQQVVSQLPADPRFDVSTQYLAALGYLNKLQWPQLTSRAVWAPLAQADIPSMRCGLAPFQVPVKDEHFPESNPVGVELAMCLLQSTSFPETADDLVGDWLPGEPKEQVVGMRLFGVGLPNPIARSMPKKFLTPLGANRYSDEGLELLTIHGFGQHLVQRIPPGQHGVKKAKYAILLEDMESIETRPGFAKHGGNIYFDKNGKVVAIKRLGKVVTPSSDASEWAEAKFALRSSLFTYITLVDHLVEIHLMVANGLVTANVEEFSPQHPIRRLLTPFGYRTEAINAAAAINLTPEHGLLHRAAGFSKKGMEDAFSYARDKNRQFKSIPQRFKDQKADELELALHQDGLGFYEIVEKLVSDFIDRHYSKDGEDCQDDQEVQAWWDRIDEEFITLPELKDCGDVKEVLSTFIYLVSAGHNHAGNVQHLASDPDFMQFAWKEGASNGSPRTALTLGLVASLTSFDVPSIMDDYTHVLPVGDGDLWASFLADLKDLAQTIAERNANRPHPFRSFDPTIIEVSVGI